MPQLLRRSQNWPTPESRRSGAEMSYKMALKLNQMLRVLSFVLGLVLFCPAILSAQVQSSDAHTVPNTNQSRTSISNPDNISKNNREPAPNGMPSIGIPQVTSIPVTQIGEGDLIEISIYGATDMDHRDFRVDEKGDISLPYIGLLHLAGLNTSQAEALIGKKMVDGQYYNDPQVSIIIREFATQGISILGEVAKPGVYPLLGSKRLFDVISLAGGLTAKAGKTVSIVHRAHPETPETIPTSSNPAQSLESDVMLEPGDTVVVSKAGIVYVVGDVKLPGGFSMENGNMTLLQAVALAQGANPTASIAHSRLIRSTPDGGHAEVPISVKDILSGKAQDVKLQPEDIVFVPNSASKSAGRRILEAAAQAAGLAVYRF